MVKKRVIVDVSDAKVSNDPSEVLMTYSLGSCIGVCLYDGSSQIGGMLHYQLPSSTMDSARAKKWPFMFADSGMKLLIEKMTALGADIKRIKIKIAGGAAIQNMVSGFNIGKRNHLAIKKIVWKYGLFIDAEDVGGTTARNMFMNMSTGAVTIRSNRLEKRL